MIIERHYDDEALIALLESDRDRSDTHLPSCDPCSGKLESFRMISGALHERDVWDTRSLNLAPVPETIRTLRAFADRMSFEDRQAEAFVAELLAGSREEWMPRLQQHPEWRTAGVVRKLVTDTRTTLMIKPPDAVEMTLLAIEIADHLHGTPDTVSRLRGAAWRERAYAMFYTGDLARSLSAVERAEQEFGRCAVADYDLARLNVIKAMTLRLLERFSDASAAAAAGAESFSRYEDLERLASARLAEVQLLYNKSQYESAEAILAELDDRLAKSPHADVHARVIANRGYCAWQRGQVEPGLRFFELAAMLFRVVGAETEVVRMRWNAALMLAEAGQLTDATVRLQALTSDMERLGMTSEVALNALQLAEHLLADGRFEEVERLCRGAMEAFERGGLAYTARALTALAYIREAAQQRVASQALARSVREYIRQLPAKPALLFAPQRD